MTAALLHGLIGDDLRADLNELARRLATTGGACGWHLTDRDDLDAVVITVYGTDDPQPVNDAGVDRYANVRQVEHAIGINVLIAVPHPRMAVTEAVRVLTEHVDAWEAAR